MAMGDDEDRFGGGLVGVDHINGDLEVATESGELLDLGAGLGMDGDGDSRRAGGGRRLQWGPFGLACSNWRGWGFGRGRRERGRDRGGGGGGGVREREDCGREKIAGGGTVGVGGAQERNAHTRGRATKDETGDVRQTKERMVLFRLERYTRCR